MNPEEIRKIIAKKVTKEYVSNKEVEELVEHMMGYKKRKQVEEIKNKIDYALDIKDEKMFYELTEKLSKIY